MLDSILTSRDVKVIFSPVQPYDSELEGTLDFGALGFVMISFLDCLAVYISRRSGRFVDLMPRRGGKVSSAVGRQRPDGVAYPQIFNRPIRSDR